MLDFWISGGFKVSGSRDCWLSCGPKIIRYGCIRLCFGCVQGGIWIQFWCVSPQFLAVS